VLPLCTDFTRPLKVPLPRRPLGRRVVYFPGSTIGNCVPDEAIALLKRTRALCGADGGLLLGADLPKDPQVLHAAYNDRRGVTARFSRNILVRINRELDADFAVEQFNHHAFYNTTESRIEIHLVSTCDQWVHVGEAEFFFKAGESIRTEYSYKYSRSALRELAAASGFEVDRFWTDERDFFCVAYFKACGHAAVPFAAETRAPHRHRSASAQRPRS
jgi:dimethylhistidine N-methyltransferase